MEVETGWAGRHWNLIREAYGRAPRFHDQLEPLLRPFFEKAGKERFLTEITQESLWLFWEPLRLRAEIHWASDLPDFGKETSGLRVFAAT
jgi:hypothetical protein